MGLQTPLFSSHHWSQTRIGSFFSFSQLFSSVLSDIRKYNIRYKSDIRNLSQVIFAFWRTCDKVKSSRRKSVPFVRCATRWTSCENRRDIECICAVYRDLRAAADVPSQCFILPDSFYTNLSTPKGWWLDWPVAGIEPSPVPVLQRHTYDRKKALLGRTQSFKVGKSRVPALVFSLLPLVPKLFGEWACCSEGFFFGFWRFFFFDYRRFANYSTRRRANILEVLVVYWTLRWMINSKI